MGWFKSLQRRNMAASDAYIFRTGRANWGNWTVTKSVKDGMKASGWVYRAVTLISRNAASVPWVIYNQENEIELNHPLAAVLAKPNKQFSRQDLIELLISWHMLAGNGYLNNIQNNGRTIELWPISPDRLKPIPSTEAGELVSGYEEIDSDGKQKKSEQYDTENIIHFKLLDPSNPIEGISPLMAAARAVDTDSEQQDWNKSAMENRGVMDGVFTFKDALNRESYDLIMEKIKERFSGKHNARTPGVVGSDAKYQRLSITPAEMDFIESRKFNREEIFIIYGVPPQLAGVTDASTYNNFSTSMRIFWENTLIPLLDDVADTLNTHLADELDNGKYRISYDTSNVQALRESEDEKAKTAKHYWDMGVPVQTINEKMELGITEFPDWDKPFTGIKPNTGKSGEPEKEGDQRGSRFWKLIPFEKRSIEDEMKRRDALADGPVLDMFKKLLSDQQADVFDAIERGESPDDAIKSSRDIWLRAMRESALEIAVEFAGTVVVGQRGRVPAMEYRDAYDDAIASNIDDYLQQEDMMLKDLSHMEASTSKAVVEQVADGLTNGATVAQIQQAIEDVGIFSAQRAHLLSRTLAGTAASVGQMAGAEVAGATVKEWMTSGFEVREWHIARSGERAAINGTFSDQGYGAPRFPLDPNLGPGDRVNCRCSMVFD